MRVHYGMPHRGRQPIELRLAQAVLGPLGCFVHAMNRHAQFVGEVELPQAMRAQDVQRNTLALGRELKLRPFRADQALAFEALRQRHQLAIAHAQRALQRSERGGMAVGGLPRSKCLRAFSVRSRACARRCFRTAVTAPYSGANTANPTAMRRRR